MSSGPTPTAAAADPAVQIVCLYQKQNKIYARAVSGWFAGWRWALVWATQLAFYGLPWLAWNGRQAVLFDLGERRFYIFGLVLYPQDFIFLTGLLIISACALFLFTTVAGRLWCGYACPQTVYTEIFMWVERKLEGDRAQRMKLDAAPWGVDKLLRKGGKQAVWIAIGLWTGLTFVGYFTPIKTLAVQATQQGLGPWEWFWTLFYGFATYGNAGYMREQVCKYMCPYARFQSAMFDPDTLIITYDAARGDPRGRNAERSKKSGTRAEGLGDCIDCGLCVQVCPTGIDIRNGLQYGCIGCAACVDICDGVMDKMNTPRGLIRYDTERGLAEGSPRATLWRRVLRPRVLVYTAILGLVCTALLVALLLRTPFKVDVVRDRGTLARIVDDGWIENVFRVHVMNATEQRQSYRLAVQGLEGLQLDRREPIVLGPAEARWVPLAVRVPPDVAARAGSGAHALRFEVRLAGPDGGAGHRVVEKSTFVVPR